MQKIKIDIIEKCKEFKTLFSLVASSTVALQNSNVTSAKNNEVIVGASLAIFTPRINPCLSTLFISEMKISATQLNRLGESG